MVLKCQRDLLHVVTAARPPSAFTGRLHRRKQEPHQGADDGDDHEEFDECESATPGQTNLPPFSATHE
jgi:hypothetical protein